MSAQDWREDWRERPKPAPAPRPLAVFKYDAARAVLRGLGRAGAKVVNRMRSPHGSDCSDSCPTGDDLGMRMKRSIGECRCLRVMRVRVRNAGDWLLIFGDRRESQTVQLQGPYEEATQLHYGGGFWCRAEV